MKVLVEDKLDFSRTVSASSSELVWGTKNDLVLAYKGFTAHNKADKVVHWQYFMAPISTPIPDELKFLLRESPESEIVLQTDEDRREAWTIHHGLKESWAEYVIFAAIVLNKPDITYEDFDTNGKLKMERRKANGENETLPTEDLPVLTIPHLSDNGYNNQKINALARLLQLAQAIYCKNRMVRSTEHTDRTGVVIQSEATIKELLRVQNERLANYFNLASWTMWEATLTTDGGFAINTQLNFVDGEAIIQVGPGIAGTVTHEYEDPENQMTDWLMLEFLEEERFAKTRKDNNGNDIPLQVLPAYQWDRGDLLLKFNEAKGIVSGD